MYIVHVLMVKRTYTYMYTMHLPGWPYAVYIKLNAAHFDTLSSAKHGSFFFFWVNQ